jgi:geranylgeranyl pyrophosphate synthase
MMLEPFRTYNARIRPLIEDLLRKELAAIFCSPAMSVSPLLLDQLQAGKKLRGSLTCLVAQALGGDLQAALPRAVAVELLQAASLVHDDFVDQDVTRRSRPAVWTTEGSRRAVLIGHVIFAYAILTMNTIGREDGLIVSRAITEISRGALREPLEPSSIEASLGSGVAPESYEEIIRLKTGVMFAAACQLGAVAAGRGAEIQASFHRFGLRLGEAYQIADDLKEAKEYGTNGVRGRDFVSVAPAVMRFAPELSRPIIDGFLDNSYAPAIGESLFLCIERMEKEIERRLKQAIDEISYNTAIDCLCSDRMRGACADIIEMFNES